ncbi:MAG: hypothetical protein AB7P02_09410 [Alphaproteobacteria bacterium]
MIEKTYTAGQIEAGFRAWAEARRADPSAFMSHEDADAQPVEERAPADAACLIRYMDAAPLPHVPV